MLKRILPLVAALLVMAIPVTAQAALKFGKDETIHYIQDVDVTGPAGEKLFLGYKTTVQNFLLGLFLQDDGYVLGEREDHDRYFAMPEGEELANFQKNGLIPSPLPPYKIGGLDYAIGYSLWIALPIIVLVYVVGWLRKRKAPAVAETGAPPPAA
jgi:hypothetical protein